MPGPRRADGISKRCECRGPDTKRLGAKCPQLSRRNHGTYQLRQEIPATEDGTRRTFRRTGYATSKDAQGDLDKVRAILDLIDENEHYALQVGDLLAKVMSERAHIPDAVEVKRRLAGGVVLDSDTTVGEFLDSWVAAKKTKRRTTSGYTSHIRVHLKPGVGHYRLDRLNVAHCQAFFDAIDDQNEVIRAENAARREQEARCKWRPGTKGGRPSKEVSARLAIEREKLKAMPPYRLITGAATQQRIRATLRAALNAAIRKQLITFTPAEWVELESGKRPKVKLWTAQHVEHWLRTGEKPSAVMVWTPAQLGQDERDIDLDAGLITPSKELVVDNWEVFEDDPKTEDSASTIALDSLNVAVIREHRIRKAAERAAWNERAARERAEGKDTPDWTETGKEFVDIDGTWLHPEKVSDEFRRIYKRAGLPPINLRDLRHLAATLTHAGGGDIFAVKKVLRHSTIQLTGDTYTELLEEVDRDIAEKAAGLVPRARRSKASASPPEEEGGSEGAEDGSEEDEDGTETAQ